CPFTMAAEDFTGPCVLNVHSNDILSGSDDPDTPSRPGLPRNIGQDEGGAPAVSGIFTSAAAAPGATRSNSGSIPVARKAADFGKRQFMIAMASPRGRAQDAILT